VIEEVAELPGEAGSPERIVAAEEWLHQRFDDVGGEEGIGDIHPERIGAECAEGCIEPFPEGIPEDAAVAVDDDSPVRDKAGREGIEAGCDRSISDRKAWIDVVIPGGWGIMNNGSKLL
jgi:hypothetical protein